MSDLFWIGRNLNVELGLLEQKLCIVQHIPPESVDAMLLPLRSIAGLLIGSLPADWSPRTPTAAESFKAATGFRPPSGP